MATKKRMKRYDEGGSTGMQKESFGDAFKRNRANGEKSFEFNGKKYTTDVKPKDSGYKMDRSPMRTSSQEFPTGANMEDMARRKRIEAEDKPLEASHPEDMLGGIGIKAAARGAKALAQAGERKAAQRATESLAAANRREALKESAAKGTRAATREADDAADIARMGSDFKKGGKIKKMAGGGSASKRADGCAQRGKTRA